MRDLINSYCIPALWKSMTANLRFPAFKPPDNCPGGIRLNANPFSPKNFSVVFVLLLVLPLFGFAQLNIGDIAFTGYNSDNPDQFSFIATTFISGGEVIYFTDRGYADEKSPPGWTTTEGILKYTAPSAGLQSGDMVVISNSGGWLIVQGEGTFEKVSGTFSLSTVGDQVFAFQAIDPVNDTPGFIAGIQMNNSASVDELNWDNIDSTSTSSNETDLPDLLTNGINAIWVHFEGEKDNSKYNNTITQGTKSEILASVNNNSNWVLNDTASYVLGYPLTTNTASSGDWGNTATWDAINGIPGKVTDVTISHSVTVTADCAGDSVVVASGASLMVNASKSLTCYDTLYILSDASNSGSLIADGTINGAVTYKRYLTGDRWHLVSSPVTGQSISGFLTNSENSIAANATEYAMMDYNTATDGWNSYFTAATAGGFTSGGGYSLRRSSDGVVSFTGAAPVLNVQVAVSAEGNGWNLAGNPYPSVINATQSAHATDNFLTVNANSLDPSYAALYLWDEQAGYSGSQNHYAIINNAGSGSLNQNFIQAGQGVFIKVKAGASTVDFTTAMRVHQATTPLKSEEAPWASVKLIARSGENQSSTLLYLREGMTQGLDIGYDAGMLKSNPDFAFYSNLCEDNGVDFAIQCLPIVDTGKLVIPLGIDALPGTEVAFSAENNGLPNGFKVVLEDKVTGSSTPLVEKESYYSATLNIDNKGRFYLHVGKNNLAAIQHPLRNVSIITRPAFGEVCISGQVKYGSVARIFDLTGRLVATSELVHTGENNINFRNQLNGIYIICIDNGFYPIREKFIWLLK